MRSNKQILEILESISKSQQDQTKATINLSKTLNSLGSNVPATGKTVPTNSNPVANSNLVDQTTNLIPIIPVIIRIFTSLFTKLRSWNVILQVLFFIKNIRDYMSVYKFSGYVYKLMVVINMIIGFFTILNSVEFVDSITMFHVNFVNFGTAYVEALYNIINKIIEFYDELYNRIYDKIFNRNKNVILDKDLPTSPFELTSSTNVKLDPDKGFIDTTNTETSNQKVDKTYVWLGIIMVGLFAIGACVYYWDDISNWYHNGSPYPKSEPKSGGSKKHYRIVLITVNSLWLR